MKTLLDKLYQHALKQPDVSAVISGGEWLDYAQLWRDVETAARNLEQLQVRSLGLYLDNGIEWIVTDLAALRAGIQVVPLPWFFSDQQLRHAIRSGQVDHVVGAHNLPSGLGGHGKPTAFCRDSQIYPVGNPASNQKPAKDGKLSFTSGSTGHPRGIELPAALIEQTCIALTQVIPHERIRVHLGMLPYATLLENIAGIYLPLMLGRTVQAEPAAAIGLTPDLSLDPQILARTFTRARPNSLILTPQLLELLCILGEQAAIDTSTLAYVAVGGAHVSPSLIDRAHAVGIPAYQGYGLTEFASVATLNTPQHHRAGSTGKPLPGVEVSLGKDDEIRLSRTIQVVEGGDTRRRKITVETGDYGTLDNDGFVFVHGRQSNLIILANGRNVSPEWVESELNSSSQVAQSYVFSADGRKLSALIFTPAQDDSIIDAEVHRINRGLPAYAQIDLWHRLDQPFSRANRTLTANGRLRRQQIQQLLPRLTNHGNTSRPPLSADSFLFQFKEPKVC